MNQQQIADHSAELIMRYYDNDYMPFLEAMDDDALWYGPAEGQFLRCHQSYLVNPLYIRNIRRFKVTMTDGAELPIQEKKYTAFRDRAVNFRQKYRT